MPNNNATDAAATDVDPAPVHPVTNRRFIELVRAKLDADGHCDIPISRQWIDEDTPGEPFLLNVPVGSGLTVPLKPRHDLFDVREESQFLNQADHFAVALVTLQRAERMLVKYAADVRREAAKSIAKARAEGLDVLLADVGFKPTYAWHLTGNSWKESAYHILADVTVRHTSFYLQPTTSQVYVEEPEHVTKELADIFAEQRERQELLAELDAVGADAIIDAVTLNLLRTHAVDVEEVLRQVCKKQHVAIPVQLDGYETRLCLISSHGKIESSMMFDGAFWNGEHVWLTGENIEDGLDLIGKTLAGKVKHPVIASRTVVHIDHRPAEFNRQDLYNLDMSPTFLFDADTGRIWQQEVRLAA